VAISAARARQICTKAELDLVLQSTTIHIAKLDAKQLKAAIRRTRTLRDKWRDLAHSQTRDTKATDPDKLGDANARSSEKAVLFDEALGRFEKRLTKVDAATEKAMAAKTPATKRAVAKVDHRADRANVREKLNEKTDILNSASAATPAKKKSSPVKVPVKKTATKASSNGKPLATKKAAPKKKSAAKPPARKPRPVAMDGLAAAQIAAEQSPVTSEKLSGAKKNSNLKAKTKAKATAVARSGAPRIQGHVSSQGRRNQAKRNSR
jgi:hypothetical protein